jgi:hypothetical protein
MRQGCATFRLVAGEADASFGADAIARAAERATSTTLEETEETTRELTTGEHDCRRMPLSSCRNHSCAETRARTDWRHVRLHPRALVLGVITMPIKFCMIGTIGLSGCSTVSLAHDIYTNLRKSNGQSCCNDTDCRPAFYRRERTGVQMFVQQRWIKIPQAAIMYRFLDGDTGETNGGHWCGSHAGWEDAWFTHCAILPPDSASR